MHAVEELKKQSAKAQRLDMIARAKDLPTDGLTYILPGHGCRASHQPANWFHVEHVVVEIDRGIALRSMLARGKWSRADEISYSDFGKTHFIN